MTIKYLIIFMLIGCVHCSVSGLQTNNSELWNLNQRISRIERTMNDEKDTFSRFYASFNSIKGQFDTEINRLVSAFNDMKSAYRIEKLQNDEKINKLNDAVNQYLYKIETIIRQIAERLVDTYVSTHIEPKLIGLLQSSMNSKIPKLTDTYMKENFFNFLKEEKQMNNLMDRHKQDLIKTFTIQLTTTFNNVLTNISSDPVYSTIVQQNIKHHAKMFIDLLAKNEQQNNLAIAAFQNTMDSQIKKYDAEYRQSSGKIDKMSSDLYSAIDNKFIENTAKTNSKINDLNNRIDLLFKLLGTSVIVILCCVYSLFNKIN